MSYVSRNIVSTTTPAKDVMDDWHPAFLEAGYEFIETWVLSTNTANIYKSPRSLNRFGQDFYILVLRTSDSSTSVFFSCFESWGTATKRCYNYAPPSTGAAPVAGTFAFDDVGGQLPNGAIFKASVPVLVGRPFEHYASITVDRVIAGASSSNYAFYAGLYETYIPGDPFPLVVVALRQDQSASSYGATTREPFITLASGLTFGALVYGSTNSTDGGRETVVPGQVGISNISFTHYLSLNGADRILYPVVFASTRFLGLWPRGLLYDVWLGYMQTQTAGDIVNLSVPPRTYKLVRPYYGNTWSNGGGQASYLIWAV